MSWTQADYDALKANIAKGVTEMELNGERVRFDTIARRRALLAEMAADLDSTAAAPNGFQVIYPTADRGL